MASIIRDFPGSPDSPVEIAPPVFEFPFLRTGDSTSFVLTRSYKQTITGYNADRLAGKYLPGLSTDSEYVNAYMLSETVPTRTTTALCQFTRTFAVLPPPQISYSTIPLTKPNPEQVVGVATTPLSWMINPNLETFESDGYIVNYAGGVFTRAHEVYSEFTIGAPVVTVASGGTFTLRYNGSETAALAYNESDANIAAAINGLASVLAEGTTWSASNNLSFPGAPALALTATAGTPGFRFIPISSITPAGASTLLSRRSSLTVQGIWCGARASLNNHGFDASLPLYTRRTTTPTPFAGIFRETTWAVVDANTIAFSLDGTAATGIDRIGQRIRTYTPGTAHVRIRETQSFYLPGVTPGINSPGEIPLAVQNTSDTGILAFVADPALTGFQPYDATRLTPWRNSPIYEQTVTEINVDNL